MPRLVYKPVVLRSRNSHLLGPAAFLMVALLVTSLAERVTTSQSRQTGAPGDSNAPKVRTTIPTSRSPRRETTSRASTSSPATRAGTASPNLANERTLYVVGYAHLDTEWRWEYPQTIGEYLPKTLRNNFALFEKYPHYVFNFSGANRYRFMKEYFPADFALIPSRIVQHSRWF